MSFIILLLIFALDVYLWLIIGSVIMSWLIAFDVLNIRNKWIYKGCMIVNNLVEPSLSRFRKVIPPIGGIDLSPMVIIFAIYIVQGLLYGVLR